VHIMKQLRVSNWDVATHTVTLTQPIPPARATDTLNQPATSPATGSGITVTVALGGAAALPIGVALDGLTTVGRTVIFQLQTT
jgi:hypothetical protein